MVGTGWSLPRRPPNNHGPDRWHVSRSAWAGRECGRRDDPGRSFQRFPETRGQFGLGIQHHAVRGFFARSFVIRASASVPTDPMPAKRGANIETAHAKRRLVQAGSIVGHASHADQRVGYERGEKRLVRGAEAIGAGGPIRREACHVGVAFIVCLIAQGLEADRQDCQNGQHHDGHAVGHSHAAPRTPDESPWRFRRIGVAITSLNTWRGSSLGSSV